MTSSLGLLFIFLLPLHAAFGSAPSQLEVLLQIKSSLDPHNRLLTSWTPSTDPCGRYFEGVGCDGDGRVVNISLQGRGLYGRIPAVIGHLHSLTGLYLHFNALHGEIPEEISQLTELRDLYLSVNNLAGSIPPQISNLSNLQVLQLCFNGFSGSIPTQLGSMQKLGAIALQYNQLSGAIPASLGDLKSLSRLDLSFNRLFGSIPGKLANAPMLQALDLRNNSLSGSVPLALRRLRRRFQYENNTNLCGVGFPYLEACADIDGLIPNTSNGFKPNGALQKIIPESANLPSPNCTGSHCSSTTKPPRYLVLLVIIGTFSAAAVTGMITLSWYRRQKQKNKSTYDVSDCCSSPDRSKELFQKTGSPLINLEYSSGWDLLSIDCKGSGENVGNFMVNLEEVERATQCFSAINLIERSSFSSTYRGILKDGTLVAIKCIAKASLESNENKFLMGLRGLASLKHENLLALRGFCCSKGRGECFFIYDYASNRTLLQHLDSKDKAMKILDWSTRTKIVKGVANGIEYLHRNNACKQAVIHQNLSPENVQLDGRFNPLLADSGLHTLLADDVVFSMLKASAAKGYLAPEYATMGRFTEKGDVYACGVIILQLLTGKCNVSHLFAAAAEPLRALDFVDENLEGNFSEAEAGKLWKLAHLCVHETPSRRPSMVNVVQELMLLND